MAYDQAIGPDTRAGLGIGYSQTAIDGMTYDTNTDFDTYQATAYIGHEDGPLFIHGSASVGWNEYKGRRHIVFTGINRTANSEYSGQDYTIFTETGYHFLMDQFTLTPIASLQYGRVNISDYTEQGAGDINLHVDAQGYDFLESGLGAKLERSFKYHDMNFVPEIHAKWLHEIINPSLSQTAAFDVPGSSAFTTSGLGTDDDTFNVGAGITLLSCACNAKTWSVEVGYDYDWRNDGYSAHQGTARFTHSF